MIDDVPYSCRMFIASVSSKIAMLTASSNSAANRRQIDRLSVGNSNCPAVAAANRKIPKPRRYFPRSPS